MLCGNTQSWSMLRDKIKITVDSFYRIDTIVWYFIPDKYNHHELWMHMFCVAINDLITRNKIVCVIGYAFKLVNSCELIKYVCVMEL